MEKDNLENVICYVIGAFSLLENCQEDKRVRDAMNLLNEALLILEKNND